MAGLNVIGGAGGSWLMGIHVPCGFVGDHGWDHGMLGGVAPPNVKLMPLGPPTVDWTVQLPFGLAVVCVYCAWTGAASMRLMRLAMASADSHSGNRPPRNGRNRRVEKNVFIIKLLEHWNRGLHFTTNPQTAAVSSKKDPFSPSGLAAQC
jgi:hypothetical protein